MDLSGCNSDFYGMEEKGLPLQKVWRGALVSNYFRARSVRTNVHGRFSFADLPASNYRLEVYLSPKRLRQNTFKTDVSIKPGLDPEPLRCVLKDSMRRR